MNRSRKITLISLGVLLAAAAVFFVYLKKSATTSASATGTPPPSLVTVAKLSKQNLRNTETFTGRIEPIQWTEIRPRVMGHLARIHFKAGQLVKQGDILFEIDPRWYQAAANTAEAEIARTEAAMRVAGLDSARAQELSAEKAISREVNEGRLATFEIAKAANLAAIAASTTARLDLDQVTVRAPISGRISRAMITEGNYISGPASLLATIASTQDMHVYTDLDEASYLKLQLYLVGKSDTKELLVRLNDESPAISATIESLDNRINSASGSILLRATVPNPDGLLTPGMFARVEIPLSDEKPAILVEESAIGTDQGMKFVLVVDRSNKATYRVVKLGEFHQGKRIIREGLTGDETIIINGLQRVRPGDVVQPEFAKNQQ